MLEASISASKRYSPMKFSKNYVVDSSIINSPSRRGKLNTNRYYCHYSNAIYMGGADSFKKNGYGILLLDSGACCITHHSHDNMIQYNIVFRDKSLTLMTIKTNKSQYISYRTGPYLITAHLNEREFAQGTGFLVDFNQHKLFKLTYYNSKIDKKQQILDKSVLDNIFLHSNLSEIVQDKNHLQGLNLKFDSTQIRSQLSQNQQIFSISLKVGEEKNGLNGLSFKVQIKNHAEDFDVMLLQRGYFTDSCMNKFGEKHFQNGNYYFGGFKNGQFNRFGMLINPQQNKWTYGNHKKGSSVNSTEKISQVMRKIHEYEDSFICNTIKITPSAVFLTNLLKTIVNTDNGKAIQDTADILKRRSNNLRTIREDFVEKQIKSNTEQIIKQQLSKQKNYKRLNYINKQALLISPQKNKKAQQKFRTHQKSKSKLKAKKLMADKTKKKQLQSKSKQNEKQVYEIKISNAQKQKLINKTPVKNKSSLKTIKQQNKNSNLSIKNDTLNKYFKTAQSSNKTYTNNNQDQISFQKIINTTPDQNKNYSIPNYQHIRNYQHYKPNPQLAYMKILPHTIVNRNININPYIYEDIRYRDYLTIYPQITPKIETGRQSRQSSVDKNCLSRYRHFKYIGENE